MNDLNDKWYEIEGVETLDSPALVFYPKRIKENIRRLIAMIDDVAKLRPHIKTSKIREVAALMLEAGIQKFKCATIAEAEMLAMAGAKDILLAYQPTQPKLLRFIHLIRQYTNTRFSCLVDNIQSVNLFSSICQIDDLELAVYIDLNVGMNRTGIKPGMEAIDLFKSIITNPYLSFAGFHAYDGHIREIDLEKRKQLCEDFFLTTEQMREGLETQGFGMPLLVAGGSPTFWIHSRRRNVEVSPGTFVFWDGGYLKTIPEQEFLPAALVITRIISLLDQTRVCVDLGYKSIACENELQQRVIFLNASSLQPLSHSEEHLVIDAGQEHNLKIGDVLYALPVHICPTVALYSHGVCIDNGKILDEWKVIARDRKITV